jgi:hypothetical protein
VLARFASVRRPGWVSDDPRVASKVVIGVRTRNYALVSTRETIALCEARQGARGLYSHPRVYMRGFQGVIVTRVCTCVCRVPWRATLVVLCTSPIVRDCHWLGRSAWDPMSLAFVCLRGAGAVLVVRRYPRIRPYVL